ARDDPGGVTARQLDFHASELRRLRRDRCESAALAVVTAAAAWAIHGVAPMLTVPLAAGVVLETFLALRALIRRQELVRLLAADQQARELPEVKRYVARLGSDLQRRRLANELAPLLELPGLVAERERLAALVDDLRNPEVEIEPFAIVDLNRLLEDPDG